MKKKTTNPSIHSGHRVPKVVATDFRSQGWDGGGKITPSGWTQNKLKPQIEKNGKRCECEKPQHVENDFVTSSCERLNYLFIIFDWIWMLRWKISFALLFGSNLVVNSVSQAPLHVVTSP